MPPSERQEARAAQLGRADGVGVVPTTGETSEADINARVAAAIRASHVEQEERLSESLMTVMMAQQNEEHFGQMQAQMDELRKEMSLAAAFVPAPTPSSRSGHEALDPAPEGHFLRANCSAKAVAQERALPGGLPQEIVGDSMAATRLSFLCPTDSACRHSLSSSRAIETPCAGRVG